MITALSSLYALAGSGMRANGARIDVIADNIANTNTTGFRASLTQFGEALSDVDERDDQDPARGGHGVRLMDTAPDLGQGVLSPSEDALHMAIDGEGFFAVQLPDGSLAYTRDGRFQVGADGRLCTPAGYLLVPGVQMPDGAMGYVVNPDGTVLAQFSGTNPATGEEGIELRDVGSVSLAGFVNPEGLQRIGHNLYAATDASGAALATLPDGSPFGEVISGALESSNTNLVEEMSSLVVARRSYAVAGRALTTVDEMARLADELVQ